MEDSFPEGGDGVRDGEASPVEIPPEALPPEILRRVAEHFVLREGTDYGEVEASLESKIADVMRQIERGDAVILFDPATESVTLVPSRDRRR